ncbi:MAG: pitrilysin family protein [Nanoarchaeota archaeon]
MKPEFYRKVLKNGMTVILEKRSLPIVAVSFAVRCGGINESAEEKGISHFVEHLLYKGTPKRNAKQIAEAIERNGGELNGFTDEIITAYWCKMPSKHISVALDVLSDMVKNPLFDQKEIDKERKVIFEEIKMRKDVPRVYVTDKIQNFLYDAPLGSNLIGTHETMSSIDRKKILTRFKEVYTPNNMILCVVGDADFQELCNFAEKNFDNKKGSVPQFKVVEKNNSSIETRKGVDQANLMFAYHVPNLGQKDAYTAFALGAVLGEGMSSRLFSEIREKRNLAYAVKGNSNINRDYSYNMIYVGTTKDKIEEVKKLILKEFEKVADELGEKELSEVKEQLIGHYQISMEDSVLQMSSLLLWEINGFFEDFYDFEKKIKTVNLEDVKKMAKLKNYSFFALVPE